jgi:hypothetical protein
LGYFVVGVVYGESDSGDVVVGVVYGESDRKSVILDLPLPTTSSP